MHNLTHESRHIWRPNLYDIIQLAIDQKSVVSIQSHFPLDKCNKADVSLSGRFLGIMDGQTQYIVENFDLGFSNVHPPDPECDYAFTVDLPEANGSLGRVEYGGRALILDQELQRNNLPEYLLLRIAQPTRIRQARKHERLVSPGKLIHMPGLMIIDQIPDSRRKLLALLAHYYQQKKLNHLEVVNISAGGVRLESDDPRCQRFLNADEKYLFFYFTENGGDVKCPSVFVGKKAGLFRAKAGQRPGLRIHFQKELIWDQPEEELKWQDIETDGSVTIKKLLKIAKQD